jgi:ketosteroid isomerase-like protein
MMGIHGTMIPPTNKKFKVDFCTLAHWKNGKIVEENLFYDQFASKMWKHSGVFKNWDLAIKYIPLIFFASNY